MFTAWSLRPTRVIATVPRYGFPPTTRGVWPGLKVSGGTRFFPATTSVAGTASRPAGSATFAPLPSTSRHGESDSSAIFG